MARRAGRGVTPHLLIDRFRFDSFVPESNEHRQLLARLGDPRLIHLLFMITPPHKTVERAWELGLEVGRYKPISDLLGHNVDAYAGMRGFFFARALQPDNAVHYEFLDNDVTRGDLPLTVAFGWSGEMNILDVNCILNIDRYRKINVNARNPLEVYPNGDTKAVENNVEFFAQCVQRFPVLNVADRNTGRIYARTESATLVWADPNALLSAPIDENTRAAIVAVIPDVLRGERH